MIGDCWGLPLLCGYTVAKRRHHLGRPGCHVDTRPCIGSAATTTGSPLTFLKDRLLKLQQDHAIIGDVRGRRLLLGIEFVQDPVTKTPAFTETMAITKRCLEKGLVVQVASHRGVHTVWRIAPPLTITYEELDRGVAIIDEAIAEVVGR